MTTPEALPFQPGWVLADRYRLGALIGRGGMAEVFRGRDELLERPVAVKVFRSEAGVDGGEAARQQAEVRALAALDHPGIVTVFDAGTDETRPGDPRTYLVLELVDGHTLGQEIAGGPMPPALVASIGRTLASALAHVHARGIVHRDVKPANVLLADHDGTLRAKLTDFGVARFLDASTRMTVFGTTVGTANYLSPEQALGADVTPAGDVYSLGLVLLECLTGRRVYEGHGVEAALARLHRDPEVPHRFGAQWRGLLVAMTQRDPMRRPSAEQVEAALATVPATFPTALEEDLPSTDTLGPLPGVFWSAPEDRRGRHRRRRRLLPAIGAAAAATAAAVLLPLFSHDGPSSSGAPVKDAGPAPASTRSAAAGSARPVVAAPQPRTTRRSAAEEVAMTSRPLAAAVVPHTTARVAPVRHAAPAPKAKAPKPPKHRPHGPGKH